MLPALSQKAILTRYSRCENNCLMRDLTDAASSAKNRTSVSCLVCAVLSGMSNIMALHVTVLYSYSTWVSCMHLGCIAFHSCAAWQLCRADVQPLQVKCNGVCRAA